MNYCSNRNKISYLFFLIFHIILLFSNKHKCEAGEYSFGPKIKYAAGGGLSFTNKANITEENRWKVFKFFSDIQGGVFFGYVFNTDDKTKLGLYAEINYVYNSSSIYTFFFKNEEDQKEYKKHLKYCLPGTFDAGKAFKGFPKMKKLLHRDTVNTHGISIPVLFRLNTRGFRFHTGPGFRYYFLFKNKDKDVKKAKKIENVYQKFYIDWIVFLAPSIEVWGVEFLLGGLEIIAPLYPFILKLPNKKKKQLMPLRRFIEINMFMGIRWDMSSLFIDRTKFHHDKVRKSRYKDQVALESRGHVIERNLY